MPQYTIMTYNIEHMNRWFENNQIKADKTSTAQAAADVISDINPHLLGICEAANDPAEHQHFINNFLPGSGYKLAAGKSRGAQNLVFYYRDPFKTVDIDSSWDVYKPWSNDIENLGIKETHKWYRRPLEVVFRIGTGGPKLRAILIHSKSKGIFDVVDLHRFQALSEANRKRWIGQALQLRGRLDNLLSVNNPIPIVVMGDFNDSPGLDPYEKTLGRSFLETVMGSVFNPSHVMHNPLHAIWEAAAKNKKPWTARFPDPIVTNPLHRKHQVLIDHILLTPDMLTPNCLVKYVNGTAAICPKNTTAYTASDHLGVYCSLQA
jgi:endonuclease/exonuclease/phosphatase family metal-dependent hydrolase